MNIRIMTTILLAAGLFACGPAFAEETPTQQAGQASAPLEVDDFNRKIYFENKLEFAADVGYFPYNTKFIFDFMEGENWGRPKEFPDYTLIPIILSLRWHIDDLGGPSFLRGNTDMTFSGSYTFIPEGPESYYAAFMIGARYNFVQPNWRVAPYLEGRVGAGFTDSRGTRVQYAQGQDFTFTFAMGGGVRYNFDPRYSISAGITYMHISNLYLSNDAYNYGINVFGPTIGVNYAF
jgi:hypothetical protein